ncbi:uncharacterized protein A4U43_C04F3150 [Asparagus officinalis]|uniref:Uncharacterized protein n=1 Tax=Asparagus officinalis TaxID=4686 RepID=A0A5P1F0K3_ASPOF|nr:uncharacterized protein A4U43_C04F3150 [Asparagus officinalis]
MFPSHADVQLRSLGGRDLLLSLNKARHLTIDCASLWSCLKDDTLPDSLYQNLETLQLLVESSMANIAATLYNHSYGSLVWEVDFIKCILGAAWPLQTTTITTSSLIHNFSTVAVELHKLSSASPRVKLLFKPDSQFLYDCCRAA